MTNTLPGNSVIDKMRASGMTDDQIMSAIINFGRQETTPAPISSSNDPAAQLRSQGYTDEQITAQIVASANAANHAGSGDPTAAGGIQPDVAALSAQLDVHAGNLQNVQATHGAHADRLSDVESDISNHGDRINAVEALLSEHVNELRLLRGLLSDKPADTADTEGDKA